MCVSPPPPFPFTNTSTTSAIVALFSNHLFLSRLFPRGHSLMTLCFSFSSFDSYSANRMSFKALPLVLLVGTNEHPPPPHTQTTAMYSNVLLNVCLSYNLTKISKIFPSQNCKSSTICVDQDSVHVLHCKMYVNIYTCIRTYYISCNIFIVNLLLK